jgi:hypothetical protein
MRAQPRRAQATPHRRHHIVDQTLSEHRAAEGNWPGSSPSKPAAANPSRRCCTQLRIIGLINASIAAAMIRRYSRGIGLIWWLSVIGTSGSIPPTISRASMWCTSAYAEYRAGAIEASLEGPLWGSSRSASMSEWPRSGRCGQSRSTAALVETAEL